VGLRASLDAVVKRKIFPAPAETRNPDHQPVAQSYTTELYYSAIKIFHMLGILCLYMVTAVVSELHVATWHNKQNCHPHVTFNEYLNVPDLRFSWP
jgi:hypothetical protein